MRQLLATMEEQVRTNNSGTCVAILLLERVFILGLGLAISQRLCRMMGGDMVSQKLLKEGVKPDMKLNFYALV